MRWKLSHIERIVDVNITCVVRLEGALNRNQIRSALARVQRKHPVLRALIRGERDGLYYESDSAPEIPLRLVARMSEDDYRRERHTELTTGFAHDQPQLRAVWLRSERESDLLLTTTHRICDGMSVFTIVREVLFALYNDGEFTPSESVSVQDLIADYQPLNPWRRRLAALLINGAMRLVPASRGPSENNEHHVEWSAGRGFSAALKQRSKAEGVSVHSLLLVALERSLYRVFGRKAPKVIVNPIDLRRGRFAALKNDTIFFGGGNIRLRTSRPIDGGDLWVRAREIHDEIRRELEKEVRNLPARFHFLERIRPLSSGQIGWIMRLGDALKSNTSQFGFSNLGNVATSGGDVPLAVKDVRMYVHSFSFRTFGLIPYTVNGDMRFYFSIDEKCMSRIDVERLQREFIAALQECVSVRARETDAAGGEFLAASHANGRSI